MKYSFSIILVLFIFCGNIFAQKDIDYWNKKLIRAINSKNVKSVVECCNAGADLTLADEDIWRVNPNNISPLIKILGQKKEYKSLIVVWEFFLYVYTTQLGNDIEDIENYFQIVAGLAACYYQINDYESAKVLFTEALSLCEQKIGKNTEQYMQIQYSAAIMCKEKGDYDLAEELLLKILEGQEKIFGCQSIEYLNSLDLLANLYNEKGNYDLAIATNCKALKIKESYLGVEHSDYALHLQILASFYENKKDYDEAIRLTKEVIKIREKILGRENENYIFSVWYLAYLYEQIDNNELAITYHNEILNIPKEALKNNHYYVTSLSSLVRIYINTHNFSQAEVISKEAVKIYKEVFGTENSGYATCLRCLAEAKYNNNNLIQAELLYKKALSIYEKVLSIESIDYIKCLRGLSMVYLYYADFTKLEPIYKEILNICEQKSFIKQYLWCLNDYARIYEKMGNYTKAKLMYQEALEGWEKNYGKNLGYIDNLHDLAILYVNMGNYVEAERLYNDALEICSDVVGLEHSAYVEILSSLANLYCIIGNYAQAELKSKEVLEMYKNSLGTNSYEYATGLWMLASVYYNMDSCSLAESIMAESLEITKEIFGSEHLVVAMWTQHLALYYFSYTDNYTQAELLYLEALSIYKKHNSMNGLSYAECLNELSFVFFNTGQYGKAEPLFMEHSNIIRNYIKANFEYLSEKERKLYWNTQSHHFNTSYPSFCYSHYLQKKSISEFAYNNALLTKGLLLNTSTQVQNAILNSGNQELIDKWNELSILRHQILKLQEKTLEEQKIVGIDSLQEEANELDKQLTAVSVDYKRGKDIWDVEWDDVKKQLKKDEVAIEFISFDYYNVGEFTDSVMYCALLLRHDSKYPEMITMFEEKELSKYLSAKTSESTALQIYDVNLNGSNVSKTIWSNITPKLEDVKTIYFSPSGLLHQVAIEYLPYDSLLTYADKFNMVRLTSTRELVLNKSTETHTTATVYGGINYNTTSEELLAESNSYTTETLLASRGIENDTLDRGGVKYLPGTKKEAEKISQMLVENDVVAELYTKNSANEESFKALSGEHKNIIHIGTHGFTWVDSVARKKDYFTQRMQLMGDDRDFRGPIIDPLNRCGLLFSGANIALQGKSSELPGGVQDGVLTAKEISLLDLRDCDLVVLSACETAKGDISSEGVFGLQRAFKMAGVQTIIMSLWKVNDKATQMLMTEFYNNWIVKQQPKREAFKNAQNAVRKEYEEPIYWAGFVMLD